MLAQVLRLTVPLKIEFSDSNLIFKVAVGIYNEPVAIITLVPCFNVDTVATTTLFLT